jgi:hypothetical protein
MASSVPGSVSMMTFLVAGAGAAAKADWADEKHSNAQNARAEAKRILQVSLRAPGVETGRKDLRNARKSDECEDTNRVAKKDDTWKKWPPSPRMKRRLTSVRSGVNTKVKQRSKFSTEVVPFL